MKTPIKKFLCSLVGFSLIISAAGCDKAPSGTTQSDAETAASTEAAAETVTATEGTAMKAEKQGFKYRPGDIIVFGKYEQDNFDSNGTEDIEWFVLAREENKLLVLSRYALDRQPYNEKEADVTWETSSLRKWLNGSFYESAFDEEEKSCIIKTNVPADKNPEYDTPAGNPTTDNVFLISLEEYNKYLKSDNVLTCTGTEYASAKDKNKNGLAFFWWLRTPGKTSKDALGVAYYRKTDESDNNNSNFVKNVSASTSKNDLGNSGVRPAMWIDLPDYFTTAHKHLNAWVEGYGTARVKYESPKGQEFVDVPNLPCQILYTDGFPSYGGEIRDTKETNKALYEWIINNIGEKNIIDGWYSPSMLYNTGHLEKTG